MKPDTQERPDFEKPTIEHVRHALYQDHSIWISGAKTEAMVEHIIDYFWEEHLKDSRKRIEHLEEFKKYVHDRLDKMGIPADPDPDNNKEHGCRIEGRLNVVEAQGKRIEELEAQMKELLNIITPDKFIILADWLDKIDKTGSYSGDEVQHDLRKYASKMRFMNKLLNHDQTR